MWRGWGEGGEGGLTEGRVEKENRISLYWGINSSLSFCLILQPYSLHSLSCYTSAFIETVVPVTPDSKEGSPWCTLLRFCIHLNWPTFLNSRTTDHCVIHRGNVLTMACYPIVWMLKPV